MGHYGSVDKGVCLVTLILLSVGVQTSAQSQPYFCFALRIYIVSIIT